MTTPNFLQELQETEPIVVQGKRYTVKGSELLASRHGELFSYHLFRTAKGNFFMVHISRVPAVEDSLKPVKLRDALEFWDLCTGPGERIEPDFEKAFPGQKLEDA